MASLPRPCLDVVGELDRSEWLELHREQVRRTAFPASVVAVGASALVAMGIARAAGVPSGPLAVTAALAAGMLAVFVAGYLWLGPRAAFATVPAPARTTRWRVGAEGLRAETGGITDELGWDDVLRVRLTRRLVTLELSGGRGLLALPRRTVTEVGEALILGWAAPETSRNPSPSQNATP